MPTLFIIDDDKRRSDETFKNALKQGLAPISIASEEAAMQLINLMKPDVAVVDVNLTNNYEREGLRVIKAIAKNIETALLFVSPVK
ncbi:MAG: hypothetical protein ABIH58_06240 [Patescibacteria group bacterium]